MSGTAENNQETKQSGLFSGGYSRTDLRILAGLLLFTMVFYSFYLTRSWLSIDEGYFNAPVLVMREGAIPHLDFSINHTGLLYYWHWFLFQLFGESILASRMGLVAISILQTSFWYGLARALMPRLPAVLTVLLMILTGPVGYPNSNPNWIGFFLLSGALLFLFHWTVERRCRWLAGSGILLGVTLLFKQSLGVFGCFAAVLGVLYTFLPSPKADHYVFPSFWLRLGWLSPVIVGIGVCSAVFRFHPQAWFLHFLLFMVPVLLMGAILYVRTGWQTAAFLKRSFPWSQTGFLLGGFLLPGAVAMALLAWVRGVGAVPVLLEDVFITIPPMVSHSFAGNLPFQLIGRGLQWGVVPLIILGLLWKWPKLVWPMMAGVLAWGVFWPEQSTSMLYCAMWGVIILGRAFLPWGVAGSMLREHFRGVGGDGRKLRVFFLLAFAVCTYLVVYPLAYFNYQLYGLCFTWLLAGVVLCDFGNRKSVVLGLTGLFVLACLVFICGRDNAWTVNLKPVGAWVPLRTDRPEIKVPKEDARTYGGVVSMIRRYSKSPDDVLVVPDNPEIYFLAGKRNPLPVYLIYPEQYQGVREKVQAMAEGERIRVVVFAGMGSRCPGYYAVMGMPMEKVLALQIPFEGRFHPVGNNDCFMVMERNK